MRSLRKTAACALATATVLGVAVAPASAERPGRADFTLAVLFSNDAESALLGVHGDGTDEGPIVDGGDRPYGSPSRAAALLDRLRAEATTGKPGPGQAGRRGEIALSGGDNFLAGPEYAASTVEGAPFYDALALEHLDLDASALGNHDFDFGPDVLDRFLDTAGDSLPFVSANLDVSGEPELAAHAADGTLVESTVLRTRGERVGLIGLTTPELPAISSPRDVEVRPELAEITNAHADDLGSLGVDKIVLVSHLQDIDNELALVPRLRGVDAVVGAGGGEILADAGDRLIPGDVAERGFPLWADDADGHRVPVVTVPGDYKYVGRLVLNFDRHGAVLGVDERSTGPVRVSGVGPDAVAGDPVVRAEVEKPVAEHVSSLADEILARSEVPLNGVRAEVRSRETNLGSLVADSLLRAGRENADDYGVAAPRVAIQNGGGIRNDSVLAPGELTALDTYDVAPFANFVAVVPDVPRDVLRQLLERGVAAAPDAAGAFMQVAGLSFTYDPARQAQEVREGTHEIVTPGERVRDVVLADGTVLVADGEVVAGPGVSVATNDFSARGGDGYPFADLPFTSVGVTYQQAVQGHLVEGLGGTVTAADYPEGGAGRITPVS
ncbi:bifunctional metallophosphatase/5'-nucleotidase [Saccharomonospora piscinae]|uniref:Bifunctional metallophosphatase/5'-nucleotidase n=1 Tax=Saccharomonospora piscinae TaxID=687388 RepID=A0A1V9A5R6_SACPI|nr:5'-nucleotidase C-terminal domain-containing protein [Saccharomonospora piscinae]OQO92477.1 bifunctional metallophosphatase/5'-nucleotidase [Saccharomonospora piscinae]